MQTQKLQGRASRRLFVKSFVLGTAASTLMGKQWLGTLLADCQPTTQTHGILRVNVNEFPALQAPNGSVRLAWNPFVLDGPLGPFYPILVNRGTGTQFFALEARCTHRGCVLPTFGVPCLCHGSQYAIDGSVVGGPAFTPLTRYSATLDGEWLCIEIPGLGFSLTGSVVHGGVSPRICLRFDTHLNAKYTVLFRRTLSDPGRVVPFSVTEAGSTSSSELTGNGTQAKVYVERTTQAGFYSVAIKITLG